VGYCYILARVLINNIGHKLGKAKPSIDTATKLADALNVSLDFLAGKTNLEIDNEIRDKILTIQRLPDKEKEHIIFAIDAMIRDAKAKQAYGG